MAGTFVKFIRDSIGDIMCIYFNLFGLNLPAYGFCIALGVIASNVIALRMIHKYGLDFNDLVILEAYCMLGGFIGAKILYFIVSYKTIEWQRITETKYFNQLMQGGFVFYGGLIGGLLLTFLAGKIHKINEIEYVRKFIFLIPFIHSFGRVGCFMAGCCYGMPYDGPGAVVFPAGSYAPAGIKLFPIQLVEAGLLLCIAIIILLMQIYKNYVLSVELYLLLYSTARFVLEFFRYDDIRGKVAGLSTSQWISIFILIGTHIELIIKHKKSEDIAQKGFCTNK